MPLGLSSDREVLAFISRGILLSRVLFRSLPEASERLYLVALAKENTAYEMEIMRPFTECQELYKKKKREREIMSMSVHLEGGLWENTYCHRGESNKHHQRCLPGIVCLWLESHKRGTPPVSHKGHVSYYGEYYCAQRVKTNAENTFCTPVEKFTCHIMISRDIP